MVSICAFYRCIAHVAIFSETVYSTTVAFMGGMQDVNMNKPDYAGFLPINAASRSLHYTGGLAAYALVFLHLVIFSVLL